MDVSITRADDAWAVAGAPVTGDVGAAPDVDLGFTPATNANAIRRLNLAVGAEAETTALWFDVDNRAIKPLRQIYRRLGEDRYEYASPDHDYRAVLTVNGAGMVTDYPDLWTARAAGGRIWIFER